MGKGISVEILDGEDVRRMMSPDLGFTHQDRDINTKRLAYIAQLLANHGVVAIVAAVSSKRAFRDRARNMAPGGRFVEVFVQCSLAECKRRDPKGLYKRGEAGEVNDIAGWHQPFEEPLSPEVTLSSESQNPAEEAQAVLDYMVEKKFIAIG